MEPWRFASGHLEDGASHASNIGKTAMADLFDDLWGHSVDGAREGFLILIWAFFSRGSEICEFANSGIIDEDVTAFDVAMGDSMSMKVLQTCQNLRRIHPHQWFIKFPIFLKQIRNTPPSHIFEKNIQFLVFAGDPKIWYDIFMGKLR